MKIIADNASEMTEICAELVKHGVTFESHKQGNGKWKIELTGGY